MSGYSNTFVNLMLGWLKGLASWVLKLFNLAGSGASPLEWISNNWIKLLVVLMIIGVSLDLLVWMIRWRPYWVWFKKKRILVNDERMLADDFYEDADDDELFSKEYVVRSRTVQHRRPQTKPAPVHKTATVRKSSARKAAPSHKTEAFHRPVRKNPPRDIFTDEMFEVGSEQTKFTDRYEDEVFNVSNLPGGAERRNRRKRK